jgi:hypothetical protein
MRSVAHLLLAVGIFASQDVRGDDVVDAGPIEKGIQLRREHRDAEALVLFRQAYEAKPTPRARVQIALAEQALGQWVEAERDLRAALADPDDPWISARREALNGSLVDIGKHLATLTVTANVANGDVWMNGARMGALPITTLRVPAGRAQIEVQSQGYAPVSRPIDLAPGASVTADLTLAAVEEPRSSAKADRPATSNGEILPTPDRAAHPPAKSTAMSASETTRHAFAWGTLTAAGVFLGVGVAAQVVGLEKASKYNDDSRCLYGELSRDERCGVYRGQAESAQTLANVSYIAAGALGITSVALFLLRPAKQQSLPVNASVDVKSSAVRVEIGGKF